MEKEYNCKKCGLSYSKGTREQTRDFVLSDICIKCNKAESDKIIN